MSAYYYLLFLLTKYDFTANLKHLFDWLNSVFRRHITKQKLKKI